MKAYRNIILTASTNLVLACAASALAQCGDSKATVASHDRTPDIVAAAKSAGQFNTLLAALERAGLTDALRGEGPFTVFAPTDEAFAKLPKETLAELLKPQNKAQLQAILTYHVVVGKLMAKDVIAHAGTTTLNGQRLDFTIQDGHVMIDSAKVIKADVKTSNGVIHVLDTVVLPSSKSIVDTAKSAKQFDTLLTAAIAAGLADTLATGGPFTVFAPTDEAFSKLPEGTVESLLKPENRDKLAQILKYHVVPGRVYSTDAVKAGKAATLLDKPVRITNGGDGVMVNDARVVMADLDASNGVIHVVDTVILPQ